MEFFFNELSIHNQFQGTQDFLLALKNIWSCKTTLQKSGFPLHCQRDVIQRPTYQNTLFVQAIMMTKQKNLISMMLSWLSKHGPFMEDIREHNRDDYLYLKYDGEIVTDYSLGEAAYRVATNRQACTVSLTPSSFDKFDEKKSIPVIWDKENEEQNLLVINFREPSLLEAYLHQHQAPIQSWAELLRRVQAEFPNLIVLDSVATILEGESFSSIIATRVIFQLKVLNRLATCFDRHGERTSTGHDISRNYFQGTRAIFSDESDSNKRKFERDMTFLTPDGQSIFCPFHGKIGHRVFRIHFSWPIQYNQPVYIAYIGPKITKG